MIEISFRKGINKGSTSLVSPTTASFSFLMTDEQVKMFDLLKESNTNLRLMLEDTLSIPIIGITAKAYKESIALCIKAGMQKVLTRPFENEELLAVIFRTLK